MTTIFISYSSADRGVAEDTQAELEGLGYRVWRDERELETDWSKEICRALATEADVLCVLWTTEAAASKWVRHEWLTARALGKRIVPCMFAGAPPLPPPLKHLHGVVVKNVPSAAAGVHERLQANAQLEVEYDFTLLPDNVHIPFRHNPRFAGRRDELAALYQLVVGDLDKTGRSLVGLGGMSGVGRTQLAVEFVLRFGFAFHAVHWISAGTADRWFERIVRWMREDLRLTIEDPEAPDADLQYFVAAREFFSKSPTLLVFDNVQDPEQLASEHVLPGTHCPVLDLGCSVLFSTGTRFDIPGVLQQQVPVLPPADSMLVLTRDRDPVDPGERDAASAICKLLGYLPLALVLANGLLRQRDSVSYADYYADLESDLLRTVDAAEMTREQLATRNADVVEKVMKDQIATLTDESAHELLLYCGLFGVAEWVPKDFLGQIGGIEAPVSRSDAPLDRAVRRLLIGYLVEEVDRGAAVRLHPLLRAALRKMLGPEREHEMKLAASTRVAEHYADFRNLETTYLSRGIDEMLFDVAQAEVWGRDGGRQGADLALLFRILSQSATVLRAADTERRDQVFSQQVGLRAVQFGQRELSDKALTRRADLGGGYFAPDWMAGHAMSSLLRSTVSKRGRECLSMSRDGRYSVTGSLDGRIVVWLNALGVVHAEWEETEARLVEFDFLGPSWHFAVGSSADSIEVWDAHHFKKVCHLAGSSGGVRSLTASPDGKRVVAACGDGVARVWSLEAPDEPEELPVDFLSEAAPICVRWGGDRVVVLYDDGTGRVGSLDDPNDEARTFACEGMHSIAVSDRGDFAVLWGGTRSATVLDLDEAASKTTFQARDPIMDLAIASERELIVYSTFYGSIRVLEWPAVDEPARLLGTHGLGGGASLSISSDGSQAVSSSYDGVRVWNPSEDWPQILLPGHRGGITDLAMRPGMEWFASTSMDGTTKFWDLGNGRILHDLGDGGDRNESVELGIGGIAYVAGQRQMVIWDYEREEEVRRIPAGAPARFRCSNVGERIVTLTFSGDLFILDRQHQNVHAGTHANQAEAIALVGEGDYAITGAGDGTLARWNLTTPDEAERSPVHAERVSSVAEVPNTPYVISGSYDGSVTLSEWRDLSKTIDLRASGAGVNTVAASPSGRHAVAASGATLRVFSVTRRKEIAVCTLWHRVESLLMPEDDLVIAGDRSGVMYCLRIKH